MTRVLTTIFLLAFFILAQVPAAAQSYFRLIDQPLNDFFQRIERFPNGDILIGDSNYQPPISGLTSGFTLIRLNECGEIVWQKDYRDRAGLLTFDQIAIDDAENIYVFGSTYAAGNKEIAFIIKISGTGQIIDNRTFDGAPMGNITYSLDYFDGELICYGALRVTNNPESCYLMRLDTNLNLLQSTAYPVYEAYGEGILLQNHGALMVTGNVILQVDAVGQVNWARQLNGLTPYVTTSIPLEVPDGSIHAVWDAGYTWFFKLDTGGNLLWQSGQFPSFYHLPEMELFANGDILAIYNEADTSGNRPVWLRLSPSGQILSQNRLQTNFPINSGFVGLTLIDDQRINLIGNENSNIPGGLLRKDFLLQVNISEPAPSCFSFEEFSATRPNSFDPDLQPISATTNLAPMTQAQLGSLYDSTLVSSISDICAFEPSITEFVHDTMMECDGEWAFKLPDTGFTWTDAYQGQTRIQTTAGEWIAERSECEGIERHLFRLAKPACECLENLQNAMTPNGDGINDVLLLQSNCIFESLQIGVFDRWGRQMFSATHLPTKWDATLGGNPVPEGVYYIILRGIARSDGGEIRNVHGVKNLTIFR